MINCNIYKIKFIPILLALFYAGCASSTGTRYEEKPKEEAEHIKVPTVLKSMEAREREYLRNNKISAIDRINFEYDSNGKLQNKGKVSTAKYDKNGYCSETIIFDQKGRAQNRFEYKYNSKDFRTESLRYDMQNKVDKKYTYEYDEAGNKIKSIRYDANGKAEKYYLYDYDSQLNLISDEWFDINGDLEYKIETEYDDEGYKTVSYTYNETGKLNFKYVFKYDSKMNLIEEQKYNENDKLVGIIQYLYKYYQ